MKELKRREDYKYYYPVYCQKHLVAALKEWQDKKPVLPTTKRSEPEAEEEVKLPGEYHRAERWLAPEERPKIKRDPLGLTVYEKIVPHAQHELRLKVKTDEPAALKEVFEFILTYQRTNQDKKTCICVELE